MHRDEFVQRYGGLYEHSPWVAERVFDNGGVPGRDSLAELLADCVETATRDEKLALIRAHPDLAGKAAIDGELTAASTTEQRSARLDQCTVDEYEKFLALNDQYREKFGFPFVMAVSNSDREQILEAFALRLENDPATEFNTAISEIHKIARLRLEAL